MFNSCTQEQGEKFDAYLIKLRHLIKTCEYGVLGDELLRDRIVTGTSNNNVQARLLSESGLTLDRAIDICRSTEQAEQRLGKLNNSAETIHYTKVDKKNLKKAREFIKDCKFCGQSHDKGKCQAYGFTCAICLKRNHMARGCQSQAQPTPPQRPNKSSTQWTTKVRHVETEAFSCDESIYALRSLSDRKHYHADVRLSTPGDSRKIACEFQIDTVASCSTLAFADYKRITKAPLQPSHTKLKLYDNSILQPLVSVTLHCEVKGIRKKITFQVVDSNSPSLLSGQASFALKLIVFNTECVRQLSEVKEGTDMWKAILEWRNATTPGMHSSPEQRFFSRCTSSMLPCKTTDYTSVSRGTKHVHKEETNGKNILWPSHQATTWSHYRTAC